MLYTFLPNPVLAKSGKNISEKVIETLVICDDGQRDGFRDLILSYLSYCKTFMKVDITTVNGKESYTFPLNKFLTGLLEGTAAHTKVEPYFEAVSTRQVGKRRKVREYLLDKVKRDSTFFFDPTAEEVKPLKMITGLKNKNLISEAQFEVMKTGYFNFSCELPDEHLCKDLHNMRLQPYMELRFQGFRNVYSITKDRLKRQQKFDSIIPAKVREVPEELYNTIYKVLKHKYIEDYYNGAPALCQETGQLVMWSEGVIFLMDNAMFLKGGPEGLESLVSIYKGACNLSQSPYTQEVKDLTLQEIMRRFS